MPHLRPTAIRQHLRASALLLALVPAAATLTSCGFDYPTDRVNTIAGGENNRDHSVDALGIRVLATEKGEGRLIGALANNLDDAASLDTVTSPDGRFQAAEFEPVEVEGRAGVNLTNEPVIALSGDFTAGQVLAVELTFSTGETASLNVPVVKACFQYTDVPTPEAEESPAEGESDTQGEAADAAAEEEVDAAEQDEAGHDEAGHDEEGGDATFNCADEAPSPESAH
ncbi:hypothetical protein ASE01_06305 [Nocardioides sp. Root190]|uniref:hypothetical protein n=1 Tax=Nocardioides sp. Root190 TaxID=1736488 RepID=UPI0006FF320B|nr:hypothetical protein [Nocardioides sp. Root190]KRB77802.1 hypothetical protein ASE01_06305 [Nocardioides sp. Root190]